MWRLVVLCGTILAFVRAQQSTSVNQCTRNAGDLPLNTYVEGCEELPCRLPQLQDVVVNIIFKSPRTIRSMRTLATAYLRVGLITVPTPYDLEQNAITCNFFVNTYCPLLSQELVQYTLRMPIESFMPVGVAPTVEFRVVDEANNEAIFCISVDLVITAPISLTANNTITIEAVAPEKA